MSAQIEVQAQVRFELGKRPWLSLEIYDHKCADAFTKANDVYALGFILANKFLDSNNKDSHERFTFCPSKR